MDWTQSVDPVFVFRLLAVALGGLATGFLGGMMGLALGRPRLLLVYWAAENPLAAAGTNLAIGFLAGMLGFLGHMLHLEVDWAVFAVIAPAAMAGATLGARQTGRMSPTALKRLMGVVMVVVALPLFWVALTRP